MTLMLSLVPRNRGAVNCPRPMRKATTIPATSDGRRSGNVTVMNVRNADAPHTRAAAVTEPLISNILASTNA